MTEATAETARGDFSNVRFEGDGMRARFFRDGDRFLIETDGPEGKSAVHEVAYTFGWKPLQQYLVRFPGGRMQAFSVAWDTEKRGWFFLYPDAKVATGDWLHWTRGAQNWNGMCAECHSTNLRKGYDPEKDTFGTTYSEINVACEACHGAASLHVAWAKLPAMARPASDDYRLVVSTKGMSSREQVELCAPGRGVLRSGR